MGIASAASKYCLTDWAGLNALLERAGGAQMDRAEYLRQGIAQGKSLSTLTLRTLLLSPTFAFEDRADLGFEIIERVAEFFSVSIRAVHVCGSAKLGFSPVKRTPFQLAQSDLDLAIIDPDCFTKYVEIVIKETEQYRDLSKFPDRTYGSFAKYLAKGIFRPDMMPFCDARKDWLGFFGNLTREYSEFFMGVSAGLYLSDRAFEIKQSTSLQDFLAEGEGI